MTRIQKVLREIDNLRDFYHRTRALRRRIQEKADALAQAEKGCPATVFPKTPNQHLHQ
jgi:hypothetical protein